MAQAVIGEDDTPTDLSNLGEDAFAGIQNLEEQKPKEVGTHPVEDLSQREDAAAPQDMFEDTFGEIERNLFGKDETPAEVAEKEEAPVDDPKEKEETPVNKPADEPEGLDLSIDDKPREEQKPADRDEIEDEFSKVLEDTSKPKKTRNDIDRLLKARRAEKERADKLAAELEETRKAVEEAKNSPKVDPAEVEDARKYRALYVAERDPEIKQAFDKPFNDANEQAIAALPGLDEKTAGMIRQYGFTAVAAKHPEWFEQVQEQVGSYNRSVLQAVIAKQNDLVAAKRTKLVEVMNNAKTYLEQKEQAGRQQQEEIAKVQKQVREEALKWADQRSQDFAKIDEKIPQFIAGADREAVRGAVKTAQAKLKEYADFGTMTPEKYRAMAENAAMAEVYLALADKTTRKARQLERDMEAMRKAGKLPDTTRRPATAPKPSTKTPEQEEADKLFADAPWNQIQ
jgi:hypothetical protein